MPLAPERTPIAHAPISAILLARNGAAELEEVVSAWNAYLAEMSRPYEILLVDDGSDDDTGARAEKLAEKMPVLRFLRHDQHQGTGAALRTGFGAARFSLILTATCDKQYHPPDLYRILEAIDLVDLVVGFRVGMPVPALAQAWDFLRRLLARVLLGASIETRTSWPGLAGWRRRWLARWVFGVRVQDPECVFRLYRRAVIEHLPIQSNSSVAQIEILAKT